MRQPVETLNRYRCPAIRNGYGLGDGHTNARFGFDPTGKIAKSSSRAQLATSISSADVCIFFQKDSAWPTLGTLHSSGAFRSKPNKRPAGILDPAVIAGVLNPSSQFVTVSVIS